MTERLYSREEILNRLTSPQYEYNCNAESAQWAIDKWFNDPEHPETTGNLEDDAEILYSDRNYWK